MPSLKAHWTKCAPGYSLDHPRGQQGKAGLDHSTDLAGRNVASQDANRRTRLHEPTVWQAGWQLFEDLLVTYGYLGVLLVSLAVNLLPFSSPSNMILAGAVTFLFPSMNPLPVGLAVAVAASIAKTVHYYVASYLGAKAGNKAGRLESYGKRLGKWGALAAFVAAATPIPDDPVVIPLAIARYSPIKFFLAYFAGKVLVSVAGAYLGRQSAITFQGLFPSNEYIIATAVASVLIASALLKADLPSLMSRVKRLLKRS